jgi:hypothetical protein
MRDLWFCGPKLSTHRRSATGSGSSVQSFTLDGTCADAGADAKHRRVQTQQRGHILISLTG